MVVKIWGELVADKYRIMERGGVWRNIIGGGGGAFNDNIAFKVWDGSRVSFFGVIVMWMFGAKG